MPQFDISLVLATLGREQELCGLLTSLNYQGVNFELIVIDQNSDERIRNLLESYPSLTDWKLVKSPPGLSRARNLGLRFAQGKFIAFPDDDGVYPPGTLKWVVDQFNASPDIDILSGVISSDLAIIDPTWVDKSPTTIYSSKPWQLFGHISSASFFVRSEQRWGTARYIKFDELLGLGSKFGSAEDVDYIYRLSKAGATLSFTQKNVLYHPEKDFNIFDFKRAEYYGLGIGAFLRKHLSFDIMILFIGLKATFGLLIKALIRGLCMRRKESLFYCYALRGRLRGFLLWDDANGRR